MDLINEKNNQLMLQNAYSISKLPDLISPGLAKFI